MMQYIVDLLNRYQGGLGFAGATVEGLFNRGAFAAGIAANGGLMREHIEGKARPGSEFKGLEKYEASGWNFADLKMTYKDKSLHFGFTSIKEFGDYFAPPPIIKFEREKNIGITLIDNGDEAEIVENFSTNSWSIDIEGIIVDMANHRYPQAKVQELARFFEINDIVEVVSPIFNDLDICSVWFKSQKIEPLEAFPDTVKFSIEAKSIRPAEFSILNGI